MASKKERFGEALGNYSLAALASGLLMAVLNVMLVFVAPSLASILSSLGNLWMYLGVFIVIMGYMVLNVKKNAHDLETGQEVFAAIMPFVVSPLLGIIIGFYLEKFS